MAAITNGTIWHCLRWTLPLAAWSAASLGCSEDPTNPGTTPSAAIVGGGLEKCLIAGSSALDCFAKVDLRRDGTNQKLSGAAGEKTEIQVGSVPPDGQLDVTFRIRNTSSVETAASLRIDDVWLTYELQNPKESAEDAALSCWDGTGKTSCAATKGKWRKVVPAGATVPEGGATEERFRVRFTSFDGKQRQAKLCMRLGGAAEYAKADLCFLVLTTAGKPKIKAQPPVIDLPYVQPGTTKDADVQISNVGDATLFVSKIDVLLDPTFALTISGQTYKGGSTAVFEPPLVIAAQAGINASVTFKPTDYKKRAGELRVFSTDSSVVGGLPVLVSANSKVPCVLVKPSPTVNFGAVQLGKPATMAITVTNCGTDKLTVTSMAIKAGGSEGYSLNWSEVVKEFKTVDAKLGPTEQNPLVLPVNGLFEVQGVYSPVTISKDDPGTQSKIADVASVDVISNAAPVSLKFTGICVKETCPEAKIVVQEGEQVMPQTVLHLKGDGSLAPGGGSITKYKWSVTQPEGVQQSFVPGPSTPNTTFQVNSAGEYTFCLDVWDNSSPPQKSCKLACFTVLAIPSQALHVELLWSTPADKDETDKGQGVGADMDLHFAHPLAQGPDQDCDGEPDPWFSNPFDAFWFNNTPKWGSAATEDDDARLDLDDTDGAGPENINLNAPQGDATVPLGYALGVHYWNDFGFGKSYATVRIYVLGKQVVELANQELNAVDFWYVGKINWPNEAMGGQGKVLQQCFESGSQCLGKKDPANPKGGKMWQPTGQPCITKCYLSPLANSSSAICKP